VVSDIQECYCKQRTDNRQSGFEMCRGHRCGNSLHRTCVACRECAKHSQSTVEEKRPYYNCCGNFTSVSSVSMSDKEALSLTDRTRTRCSMFKQPQLLTIEHRYRLRGIPANPVPCTYRECGQSAVPRETESAGSPPEALLLPAYGDAARAHEPSKRSRACWLRQR
jgi:hypothetical protein